LKARAQERQQEKDRKRKNHAENSENDCRTRKRSTANKRVRVFRGKQSDRKHRRKHQCFAKQKESTNEMQSEQSASKLGHFDQRKRAQQHQTMNLLTASESLAALRGCFGYSTPRLDCGTGLQITNSSQSGQRLIKLAKSERANGCRTEKRTAHEGFGIFSKSNRVVEIEEEYTDTLRNKRTT